MQELAEKEEKLKNMRGANDQMQGSQLTNKFIGEETYLTQVNQKDEL